MMKLFQQRGAMFGLDARMTLAIMAGLSIVAGASMLQIMKDRRADSLLLEQQKVSSAVAAIQEDLETNINSALTTVSRENAYMALIDGSLINATFSNRWRGPYLPDVRDNNHREYGTYGVNLRRSESLAGCTAVQIRGRLCSHYLSITQVPLVVINNVNEALDGTGEATPASEGVVMWDTVSGDTATIYMRLGLAAP